MIMNELVKELHDIKIKTLEKLLLCYFDLEPKIQWLNKILSPKPGSENISRFKQAGLQYRFSGDPFTDASEDHTIESWLNNVKINPLFENTPFEDIINEYDFKRTRLMWISPFSCYAIHTDYSPRFHIPLITNKECYFVFKDEGAIHLPVGNLFWVDTTKPHTFMNCSNKPRLHLVSSDFNLK